MVRALGQRPRLAIDGWDEIDAVDEVDEEGATVGVTRVLTYLAENLKTHTASDAGGLAEEFYNKFSRKDGESMKDYVLR